MKKPELLAPVGDVSMLQAAIDNGADAVYFGTKLLNMRAMARNFELSELSKIVKKCHDNNVKAYLTVNIVVYNNEIPNVKKLLDCAKLAKIDAIICWDPAIIMECKKRELKFHISTQAGVANEESAKYYKKIGAQRIVLARECTLKQTKEIIKNTNIEVETFIHGAMCVSFSGRCFMSHFMQGKSANRGECTQPCRRSYKIYDSISDKELILENHHIMSPKDLCTIPILNKLVDAKIHCFKIEGRAKQPEYVATVTKAYRRAIDAIIENKYTDKLKKELIENLKKVYNRGLDTGFYEGTPNEWDNTIFGQAKQIKIFAGKIRKVYNKVRVVEIDVTATPLNNGDKILIQGPTSGSKEAIISNMQDIKDNKVNRIKKGIALIKLPFLAKQNEKVFIIKDKTEN